MRAWLVRLSLVSAPARLVHRDLTLISVLALITEHLVCYTGGTLRQIRADEIRSAAPQVLRSSACSAVQGEERGPDSSYPLKRVMLGFGLSVVADRLVLSSAPRSHESETALRAGVLGC